jgi:16S rRNA (guanine527-N7)-methyltransferase
MRERLSTPRDALAALAADREQLLRQMGVSRETLQRLDIFVDRLLMWQSRMNLVAPSTLGEIWTRHVGDSLQLAELAPDAQRWLDLGSGGGFPGLVVAAALKGTCRVTLVESNSRKCAFLRDCARAMQLDVRVVDARIEAAMPSLAAEAWDVVSARALASLSELLAMAEKLLTSGSVGLFCKGELATVELTEASKSWMVNADLLPSRFHADGRIVVVRGLSRR